ncbi:MAG: hypothetical protein KDA16_13995 [Phycisphaerales bacterium]|nr:hypothetical protein [Phycisphaerales bacterium]
MSATSVDLIDLVYTGSLVTWIKEVVEEKVAFNYTVLLEELARLREERGYRKSDGAFAPAAVDLMSERQFKFTDALQHRGIAVERIDYRQTYVSRTVEKDVIYQEATPLSVAPVLSFLLGRLAERGKAGDLQSEALVVTGSFDMYHPLRQLVDTCKGRAGLVYFKRLLDPRWSQVFEEDTSIEFHDITSLSEAILGVDLAKILAKKRTRSESGISSF